jgi:RNA-binding protein
MLEKAMIKKLKSEAHHLKAELNIGKDGLSNEFITSLNQAFNTKTLLKIKRLDNCPIEKEEIVSFFKTTEKIVFVQNIGNVFTLYKEKDQEN